MAGRRCTVCWHEARPEIEAAIIGKHRQQDIANRFGLSKSAVGRHSRNHMDKGMVQAQRAEIERLQGSGSIEDRLDAMLKKAEDILWKAETASSVDTQIRALAECRKQVELLAKVIGQVKDETTIQILQVIDRHDSEGGDLVGLIEGGDDDRPTND